ncbi:MAG: type I secretion system permease/ATPase [Pseudomonadota bacterium]
MPEVAKQSRNLLNISFLFSIFVNLLMLTGPLFMLQVYDRVLGSRSEETLVALLVLVLALYGLMWLLDFARTRLVARYGARFQASLDDTVFKLQLTRGHLGNPGIRSASRDLEAVQGFFASPSFTAMMDIPFSPLFMAVIFTFHPWLGWCALAGAAVLVAVTFLNQSLTAKRVAEAQMTGERANQFGESARHASDLIRSQSMLEPVTERWMKLRVAALTENMTSVDWTGAFTTLTKSFRLALQSLILALGAYLVLRGEMTAGAMIAGSILMGRALAPIEQVIGRWPQLVRARQGWASLSVVLAEEDDQPQRTKLPRPESRLDVSGVTLTLPGKPPLLHNVSFSVAPGEALGVIGRSGSGKSTIAKTLLNLVTPGLGEVRLGGALLSHYAPEDLGAHIGYLPQDAVLISGTIAENIARMSLSPDDDMIVEAAKKAKAHELILSLPDGYETQVQDSQVALSGGQRQRIALARALYGAPVLLVLDEPNSALDQEGSEALNAAIRTMKEEGRSVVIMTHRPVAISECDTLLILERGTVTAYGPRDDVIKKMMKNAGDVKRTLRRVDAT